MCSDPDKPKLAPVNDDNISAREQSGLGKIRFPNSRSTESSLDDIEMAHKAPGNSPPMLDINHYRVVNQFWHYCSVDPGSKCRNLQAILWEANHRADKNRFVHRIQLSS